MESDFDSKDFGSVLEKVLTISETIEKAYASSLRDYMRWKWPDSKLDILENLKEVVRRLDKGKLIFYFSHDVFLPSCYARLLFGTHYPLILGNKITV